VEEAEVLLQGGDKFWGCWELLDKDMQEEQEQQ